MLKCYIVGMALLGGNTVLYETKKIILTLLLLHGICERDCKKIAIATFTHMVIQRCTAALTPAQIIKLHVCM